MPDFTERDVDDKGRRGQHSRAHSTDAVPQPAPLTAGSTFAGYRIEGVACRGGMGVILRARQLSPNRPVALKILAPELGGDREFRARFERESHIVASLEHPHIIPVYESGEVDGLLFIAMRYIEGADLRGLIEHGLDAVRAARIVAQVADALDAAHAQGLVHRDVKPANILIGQPEGEPHAYLTDFGVAKRAAGGSALTIAGGLLGTIDYMAPEQIRAESLDARADVYGLACVLHECLTGQPPYTYDAPFAKLWAHVNEPPPSILGLGIDVPARLEAVLARGMAKGRDQRYRSAGDLARAALAALEGQPAPGLRRAGAATEMALGVSGLEDALGTGLRPSSSERPAGVRLELPRALRFATDAPFVGRDAELARLRALWEETSGGAGALVAVAGEAGIGKTRLGAEVARAVHREGALVLYGRCDDALAVPYQPFVEALRPYASVVGSARLRNDLGRLASELARLLPELEGLGEPLRADPETERFTLFEAVTALLAAATREQPALLVLDDLHWAARPTLLMLRHLVRSERRLAALVFGTYRQTELDSGHPLAELLSDLQRDASAQRTTIGGLDTRAIAALLETMAGQPLDDRAEDLVRVLESQTRGNPFFIRELLAHLFESRVVSREGEHVTADLTAAELEVPAGLQQVIGERVGRLSESAQRALEIAAVAGPTFSLAHLALVLGAGADELEALDEAVAGGLLAESERGQYTFSHALVRQALYRKLGRMRRMRLHRQLGEALETLQDPGVHLEALAHHFSAAAADGQAAKAADYALAAGKTATTRVGYEEAVAHYERGLDALALAAEPQAERRCELLLMLGDAQRRAGDVAAARDAFAQAASLARAQLSGEELARAALGFGAITVRAGETDRTLVALLEQALERLGPRHDALRARLSARLARELHFGSAQRRRELALAALKTAERTGDPGTRGFALSAWHVAVTQPDTTEQRLDAAQEIVSLAAKAEDRELELEAHVFCVVDLLELGRLDAIDAQIDACARLSAQLRQPALIWQVTLLQGMRALLAGHFDDAARLADEALRVGRDARGESAVRYWFLQEVARRRECGGLEEMEAEARRLARDVPALWRDELAYLLAELGRIEEARALFEQLAADDFGGPADDMTGIPMLVQCAEVCARLGDAERATVLYERLLPHGDRWVVLGSGGACAGSAQRSLGLLAATMSRLDDAAGHYESAIEVHRRTGALPLLARSQEGYAQVLSELGERARATELAGRAVDTARALGMVRLVEGMKLAGG